MADPAISAAEIIKGRTGTPVDNENRRIIEEYKDYFIGFAEFDDQGWAYSNGQQLEVIRQRIDAELTNPSYDKKDFLVLVFVHGWHHNAHSNDGNVQEFRQMVNIAAKGLESGVENGALKTHRRVIGIYVGWRGESVNAVPFNYLTVFDRRNAAERVATGAVRQLFANLRAQQLAAQAAAVGRMPTPAARMRTVVIGHSFGGLIAYSALSQAELNELTLDQTGSSSEAAPSWRVWPDALVLINPAFEASRYESFDRLIKQGKSHTVPDAADLAAAPAPKSTASANALVVPHFIVVAGDKDHWTGKYFTAGRALTTLFEGYDRTNAAATRAERTANLHAIAFVDAYQTHRLELDDEQPREAVAHLVPRLASQVPVDSPVWVVKADDAIVHGHDGFLYGVLNNDKQNPQPYLANWLLALYDRDCNAAPQMANCIR